MTLVIAHRTCPLQTPDNSLAGIRAAAEVGADAVEVDVRTTRDGVPFLVHDRTLWRVARRPLPVELLSSRRVRRLRRRTGDPIASLDDALVALPDGMIMAVEIKRASAARGTVEAVRRAGAADRVWLWSKRSGALGYCARELPGTPRALLRDARTSWGLRRFLADAARLGVPAISAHWAVVTPAFAAAVRSRDLELFAMARSLSTQDGKLALLDGVVTDWPAEARTSLTKRR